MHEKRVIPTVRIGIFCIGVITSWISAAPFTFPAVYQCTAVRYIQEKAGRTYTRGYQTPYFFIRITPNEIRAYGTHSEIRVCRKISIKRIVRDTLFLDDPEEVAAVPHSDLKIFMVNDTLMGTTSLIEADSSTIRIKALVKKLVRYSETELEKMCRERR